MGRMAGEIAAARQGKGIQDVIPLYFRSDAYVMPRWLEGITPTGHQYPTTLWVEQWRAAE